MENNINSFNSTNHQQEPEPQPSWLSRHRIWGYVFLVLIFAVVVAGVYWIENRNDRDNRSDKDNKNNMSGVCIQVVTPARNPQTGEVKEFPTPCDVPEGWEVIEPDEVDETANWQTYRNEEYGFELKYPAGWNVKTSLSGGVDPVFEFSGQEGKVFVLPKGAEVPPLRVLGTGTDGKEFATREGKVFLYRIKFDDVSSSWTSSGVLYAQARTENVQEYPPVGLQIPISADINDSDIKVINRILSTFKFID